MHVTTRAARSGRDDVCSRGLGGERDRKDPFIHTVCHEDDRSLYSQCPSPRVSSHSGESLGFALLCRRDRATALTSR